MPKISGIIASCFKQEFLAFEALINLSSIKPLWEKFDEVIVSLPQKNIKNPKIEIFTLDRVLVKLVREEDNGSLDAYKNCLKIIKNKYIYFTMDDRLIYKYNSKKLTNAIEIFLRKEFNCIRLNNDGPLTLTRQLISKIPNKSNYKVSLTNILLEKNFFEELILNSNNIWEIDKFGGKIQDKCGAPSLLNLLSPIIEVDHLIYRGKVLSYSKYNLLGKKLLMKIPYHVNFFYRVYNFFFRKLWPIYNLLKILSKL